MNVARLSDLNSAPLPHSGPSQKPRVHSKPLDLGPARSSRTPPLPLTWHPQSACTGLTR
jgi:hypothetical protein